MAQHDYDLANAAGAAFRADLNNALSAVISQNSGASAPTVTVPHMLWYDTANTILKKRNAGNTGWISLFSFDEGGGAATFTGALDISGLTAETVPAALDTLPFYDASATASRKITLPNFFKAISVLSALTAPDVADTLPIYDADGSIAAQITLPNLFKVINGFTEETSPDMAADFVPVFSTADGAMRKVKPANLSAAGGGITTIASGSLSGASVEITSIPATYSYLALRVAGASHNGGSSQRLVAHVSTNNGSSYDATAGSYQSTNGIDENLIDMIAQNSGATISADAALFAYQAGPLAAFQSYATGNNPNSGFYVGSTAAINALRLRWSGGASFDAGTYALYGVG